MVIQENHLYSAGAECITYKSGEYIFQEGDFPHFYYQIITGQLKLNAYNEEGKEFILSIVSDGESFAESFIFSGQLYPMDAEALTECTILRLHKNNFLKLLEASPQLYLNVCKGLSYHLHNQYTTLHRNSSPKPADRLLGLLSHLKNSQQEKKAYSFLVPLTRQQLASCTGICVETAIRTIKTLERQNILKIKDRKIYF